MSTFEIIGVEHQYNARNSAEAEKSFEKSCDICSYRGYHISCKHCHIAAANSTVLTIFAQGV